MSRCHQTDAILDATFAGTDLTRTQAAHAAVCGECARALSQSRRFESDLNHVGLDVSPEPMPPAAEVAFLEDPYPKGAAWMTLRRVFAGGAIAVVVVGAVLIGVKWLPGNVTPIGVGSEPPAAALAGEFDGWLRDAGEAVADSTGEACMVALRTSSARSSVAESSPPCWRRTVAAIFIGCPVPRMTRAWPSAAIRRRDCSQKGQADRSGGL